MILTGKDRELIGRARELAALSDAAAVCGHVGDNDRLLSYVTAFREAQELLRALAVIAERPSHAQAR